MSAVGSKRLANLTMDVIGGLCNEETFNMMYDTYLNEAKQFSFVDEPVLKRKRKAPNYSILQYVEGCQSTASSHYSENPRDHYREFFYESIDALVSSVRERFEQPSFLAFEQFVSLLLKSIRGEDTSQEVSFVSEKYSMDVNVDRLKVELQTFKVMLRDENIVCFDDLLEQMRSIPNEERKLIENVSTVRKLLAVNPATTATAERTFSMAERTFSMAKRIKIWMRSTMLPYRFNSPAILHFHKKQTDRLDLIAVANSFTDFNDNRKRQFGQFTNNDKDCC